MKKILFYQIIIGLSFIFFTYAYAEETVKNYDPEKSLTFGSYKISHGEVMGIAKNAIKKSFENITNGIIDTNFPDTPGPSNFEFPKERKYNYDYIVGNSYSNNNPSIVTFLIGPLDVKGVHIAVVIDIKNKKALKVYNYPGS